MTQEIKCEHKSGVLLKIPKVAWGLTVTDGQLPEPLIAPAYDYDYRYDCKDCYSVWLWGEKYSPNDPSMNWLVELAKRME